jgi:hypothetical protein
MVNRKGGTFTKRGQGFIKPAKYPFTTMEIGQSVTYKIESEDDDRRLRRAVSVTNQRKGVRIRGRKIADDLITFTRIG